MANRSPEVDRYIEKAPEFAKPILERIRRAFHKAHPEITEAMKWSFPHFEYRGVVGSMAAFKQHVSWGFWKAKLMDDPHGLLESRANVKDDRVDGGGETAELEVHEEVG